MIEVSDVHRVFLSTSLQRLDMVTIRHDFVEDALATVESCAKIFNIQDLAQNWCRSLAQVGRAEAGTWPRVSFWPFFLGHTFLLRGHPCCTALTLTLCIACCMTSIERKGFAALIAA